MAKQKKPSIPPEIKSYIDEVAKKNRGSSLRRIQAVAAAAERKGSV